MENYEQDEKKFRKNIKHIFLCGLTAIVIAGGYDLIKSYTEPQKDDSSKTRIKVITEYQDPNGDYYMAPEGYHLENVNGTICAVREVREVIDANMQVTYSAPEGYHLENVNGTICAVREVREVIDANMQVTYSAPAGYTLVGNKAVRVYKEYAEPILVTENHTSLNR